MILQVAAEGATLGEPDDFRALSVATSLGTAQLRAMVSAHGIGEVDADDEHVWLEPDSLRRAAGARASDADWAEGLAAMLDYAVGHGWADAHGRVRAHLA